MGEKHYAVLIDADNTSYDYVEIIINEVSKKGTATIRRIYGDWTNDAIKSWKEQNLAYSLIPIQQYAYTTGKNATDSAMIIDAMDLLYTANVDGFCLVSSDSDFTRLAQRLREAGKDVIGMGRKITPAPFVKACSEFKFLDLISDTEYVDIGETVEVIPDKGPERELTQSPPIEKETSPKKKTTTKTATKKKSTKTPENSSETPFDLIKKSTIRIIDGLSDDNGWVLASDVGMALKKQFSDFDPRNYNHKKLVPLLESMGLETKKYQDENNKQNPNSVLVYVRKKQTRRKSTSKTQKS